MKLDLLGQKLRGNERLFGLFSCSYSTQAVEAIAQSGYDFFIFDAEHCPSSLTVLHTQLMAMASTTTAGIVRVSEINLGAFKQYLDLGVHALMVPNVHTADEARLAVRYTKYPPLGSRGVAGSVRASRYGRDKLPLEQANAQAVLIAQAESQRAIDNIDEIAAVDGVDAIFFGPNDLAADMGHFGAPTHPEVVDAIVASIQKVRAAGKVAGVLAGEKDCGRYIEAGASMVAVGSEIGILVAGADSLAKRVREQFGSEQFGSEAP